MGKSIVSTQTVTASTVTVEICFHSDIKGSLSVYQCQTSHFKSTLIRCCTIMKHENIQLMTTFIIIIVTGWIIYCLQCLKAAVCLLLCILMCVTTLIWTAVLTLCVNVKMHLCKCKDINGSKQSYFSDRTNTMLPDHSVWNVPPYWKQNWNNNVLLWRVFSSIKETVKSAGWQAAMLQTQDQCKESGASVVPA